MKKSRYSAARIRDILTTAYPGKSEEEIERMVKETLAQYRAEGKRQDRNARKNQNSEQE